VIVAPGTDQEGAARLVERIAHAVQNGAAGSSGLRNLELRTGFYATDDEDSDDPVVPEELLRRATEALRKAQVSEN
jgi:GGDEF domain-containing protein